MAKHEEKKPAATPTPASAAAEAEANGSKRKQLPKVDKVFKTKEACDEGQKKAAAAGHTYDTRKFLATSADGKVALYVLGYSPANAASQVFEDLGIKVTEIDGGTRKPFQPSKEKATETIIANAASLTPEQKAALLKALGGK